MKSRDAISMLCNIKGAVFGRIPVVGLNTQFLKSQYKVNTHYI